MNILIAPDSYKGSLSAVEFCEIAKEAILKIMPDAYVNKLPMADGGEGTVDAIVINSGGKYIDLIVSDPLMNDIKATYGYIQSIDTAVIEMSSASGLPLVEENKRNPMITTSFGTGQLIKDALDKGCKSIILGIGGSATNDGGLGALTALGAKFYDANNKEIAFGARGLLELKSIDISNLDKRLLEVKIVLACDVDNPLYGINGAAYVYGKQKGADDNMIIELDNALRNLDKIIQETCACDISSIAGAGAAGGFGASFIAFANVELKSGFSIINELIDVNSILEKKEYDLIITGEGQMNKQTFSGKLPMQIARIARASKVEIIAVVGSLDISQNEITSLGINSVYTIMKEDMTLEYAIENAKELLYITILDIMKKYKRLDI